MYVCICRIAAHWDAARECIFLFFSYFCAPSFSFSSYQSYNLLNQLSKQLIMTHSLERAIAIISYYRIWDIYDISEKLI